MKLKYIKNLYATLYTYYILFTLRYKNHENQDGKITRYGD